MTRLFWLSFVGLDPAGAERFLGVCLVEVDDEDRAEAKAILDVQFPQHTAGVEEVAAMSRKAHLMGCNPGGQMLIAEVDPELVAAKGLPLYRLLSRAELTAAGVVEASCH